MDLETQVPTIKERLIQILINFRYESSMGLGERGLMPHHITALTNTLMPFIEKYVTEERGDAFTEGYKAGQKAENLTIMGRPDGN